MCCCYAVLYCAVMCSSMRYAVCALTIKIDGKAIQVDECINIGLFVNLIRWPLFQMRVAIFSVAFIRFFIPISSSSSFDCDSTSMRSHPLYAALALAFAVCGSGFHSLYMSICYVLVCVYAREYFFFFFFYLVSLVLFARSVTTLPDD